MTLYKGKYQLKPYSQVVGDNIEDKLQPADFKNKKYFKTNDFSGSLGKRDGRFNYRKYKKEVSRSIFTDLETKPLREKSPRNTNVSAGEVVEHQIHNEGPFRATIVMLSEYDEKPATASMSGSIAFGTSVAKGSSYILYNTSTGSITATSWSFFPTVELSKSDGTPIGEINIFGANPYYITSGSERFDSVIVRTDPTTGENFQLNHIKVEGDYLDTVTYELTTKVYPLT